MFDFLGLPELLERAEKRARLRDVPASAVAGIRRVALPLSLLSIPVALSNFFKLEHAADLEQPILRKIYEATDRGNHAMSDATFQTFRARRAKLSAAMDRVAAAGEETEKTANQMAGKNLAGFLGAATQASGRDPFGQIMRKLLYKAPKDVSGDVMALAMRNAPDLFAPDTGRALPATLDAHGGVVREGGQAALLEAAAHLGADVNMRNGQQIFEKTPGLSAGKIVAGAGALGALGAGMDMLYEPAVGMVHDELGVTPGLFDEFATATARGLGQEIGSLTGDAASFGAQQALGAVTDHHLTTEQRRIFGHVVTHDPILKASSNQEKAMLEKAFKTMARFSPYLASDEFAVKNYLREALMSSSGGPDYGTIANLARANESIAPRPR